ncbi:MAG: GntR family transcriptional regulator [Actinobacteria bacterium]|nr:GntR family transcriptional regulator [Actinomycetota bacterium]
MALDHQSFEPLYHQLKVEIRNKIKSGVWKEGNLIPSESEFCNLYKVSRATVRQALQDLVNEGLLYRLRGKGTFVAHSKLDNLLKDTYSFTTNMLRHGLKPSSLVLKQELINPSDKVIEELKLSHGDKVVFLERVRKCDSITLMLDRVYVPYKLCPGLESVDLSGSLYEVLTQKYKYNLAKAREFIELGRADKYVAKWIEVEVGEAIILKQRLTYLEDETPIEYSYQFIRGDRCRFVVELTHNPVNMQVKNLV